MAHKLISLPWPSWLSRYGRAEKLCWKRPINLAPTWNQVTPLLILPTVFAPAYRIANPGGLPVAGAFEAHVFPHDHGSRGNLVEWYVIPQQDRGYGSGKVRHEVLAEGSHTRPDRGECKPKNPQGHETVSFCVPGGSSVVWAAVSPPSDRSKSVKIGLPQHLSLHACVELSATLVRRIIISFSCCPRPSPLSSSQREKERGRAVNDRKARSKQQCREYIPPPHRRCRWYRSRARW